MYSNPQPQIPVVGRAHVDMQTADVMDAPFGCRTEETKLGHGVEIDIEPIHFKEYGTGLLSHVTRHREQLDR